MTMRAGLADPVLDAQGIFRSVLDALAHPGRVVTVPTALEPPAPLGPATAAVCLTLLDFETPLWLDPAARTPEVLEYLRFHCGVPICQSPDDAAFSVLADGLHLFPLGRFQAGSDEYPDRSTTAIVQAAEIVEGVGRRLTGPGIDGQRRIDLQGVSGRLWDMLRENGDLFPRGIDVLVTAGPRLVGLPRTTRVGD
jgi:alpha-D-ribose 1-methylphosphonate 5-triphosphate synthase subunit PhnH